MWIKFLFESNFLNFFFLFMAVSVAYGGSWARGRIRAAAAGPHHYHSNTGSELYLQPMLQLVAMPSPWPVERGQGSNPYSQQRQS